MKTKIIAIDGTWARVKNACRTTVNKVHTEKEPSSEFKTKLLISEHSPIRVLQISWIWENIKSWSATHWVRHKWECFVSTQRTDRTGINRDELKQDELVDFEGNANPQHLIDSMRKRLCFKASPETRELAEDLKITLKTIEPEISDVLVPNCLYRNACPEFEECGFWKMFNKLCTREELCNIKSRYFIYNKYFHENREIDT